MNHLVGSSEDEDHSRVTRLLGKNSGEFELKVIKLNESALSFTHFLSFGVVLFLKHKIHHSTHDCYSSPYAFCVHMTVLGSPIL